MGLGVLATRLPREGALDSLPALVALVIQAAAAAAMIAQEYVLQRQDVLALLALPVSVASKLS